MVTAKPSLTQQAAPPREAQVWSKWRRPEAEVSPRTPRALKEARVASGTQPF